MMNSLLYPGLLVLNAVLTIALGVKNSFLTVFDDLVYYLFGYTDLWCYFDNEHHPIQVRYVKPSNLNSVDFFYNNSLNLWYKDYKDAGVTYLPWVSAILKVGNNSYDLSEFVMNQKVKMDVRRQVYPTADQIVSAWCLKRNEWFTYDERCDAVLTVMDSNCDEFELGLLLNSDDEVNTFGKSVGIDNYVDNVFDDGDADATDGCSEEDDADADATNGGSEDADADSTDAADTDAADADADSTDADATDNSSSADSTDTTQDATDTESKEHSD